MSRVYDTPRYQHQTLNKVVLHVSIYNEHVGESDEFSMVPRACDMSDNKAYLTYLMGMYEVLDGQPEAEPVEGRVSEAELYARYAALSGIQRSDSKDITYSQEIGRIFKEFLSYSKLNNKNIYCDSDATFRITQAIFEGRYTCDRDVLPGLMNQHALATTIGKELAGIGTATCRLGKNVHDAAVIGYTGVHEGPTRWKEAMAWCEGVERMRMRGMTKEVHDAHEHLRNKTGVVKMNMFDNSELSYGELMGARRTFRFCGLNILEFDDAIYFLDFSASDQIHGVAKMWEGSWNYATNYHIVGTMDCPKVNYLEALDQCRVWLSTALKESSYSESIPRSMKQSVALLQNDLHTKGEKLETHHDKKSRRLRSDICDVVELSMYWHELITNLDIPDRAKMDIANLYYCLPAPDCDVQELFAKASEYMQNSNTVDREFWDGFMKYCKSLDFCKIVAKDKRTPNHKRIDGYVFEESLWFQKCMIGQLTLPPEEELGMVWIYHHFPFNDTLPTWYWEAADVTRVDPDIDMFKDLPTTQTRSRENSNELLYALGNAPLLGNSYHPNDIYKLMRHGTDKWDRVAEMAAKCENTKPHSKVRETWSADDITRELTSCFDRTAIAPSSYYMGVTSRRSDIHCQKIFDEICKMTDPTNKDLSIIVSNDVSGWSPQADRIAWTEHHNYIAQMSTIPDCMDLAIIWRNIHAVLAKRGFLGKMKLSKGLFQGWTGTMDSMLNVRLSLYCVRQAKKLGFLLKSEGAHTAGLIDDAVQAVVLDTKQGVDRCQEAADSHFDITCDTWEKAGAKIEDKKTMYSTSKFLFLNKLHCEGNEVQQPHKIYARADREFNRRFAAIHDQFNTVFGSFRSASEKGACPIACYVSAMIRCVRLAILTNPVVKVTDSVKVANAAFAPVYLGGWGFPTIGAFLTQESLDQLSMYTATMSSLCDAIPENHLDLRSMLTSLVTQTLEQEKKRCSISQILASPMSVPAVAAPDPSGSILSTIKKGMLNKCKSTIFRQALEPSNSSYVLDIIYQVLRGCTIDMCILTFMGQCLPDSCSAALVDRAYKNELITQLFPFKVRSMLSRKVINGGKAAISHLLKLEPRECDTVLTRRNAFTLARDTRDDFFTTHGLNVVNHTIPDYCSSIVWQPQSELSSMTVQIQNIRRSCPQDKYEYKTMYDGIPVGGVKRGFKTSSAFSFTGTQFRNQSPVQKCINKAAIVAAFVTSKGGNGRMFWDLVCASWGAPRQLMPPSVEECIKSEVSTKRVDAHLSLRTHEIACFKNTQSIVSVDATKLGRWMSNNSAHIDFMSYITAAKLNAILECAAANSIQAVREHGLSFAFLPDSLPLSIPDTLTIDEPDDIQEIIPKLFQQPNPDLFGTFLSSMVDIQFTQESELEQDVAYTGITYSYEKLAPQRIGSTINIRPGFLTNIINVGSMAASASRKVIGRRTVQGDEFHITRGTGLHARFRKYCSLTTTAQAVITCMVENVLSMTPQGWNSRIMTARWADVPSLFEAEYGGWRSTALNTLNMARGLVKTLPMEAVRALMGHIPHHELDHIASLSTDVNDISLKMISYMYCAGNGRPRVAESYTLMSALGDKYIQKCWRTAARVRSVTQTMRTTEESKRRKVMSYIYSAIADSVQTYTHKADVICAIASGSVVAMNSLFPILRPPLAPAYDGNLDEYCRIITDFSVDMIMRTQTGFVRDRVVQEIGQIINDCMVLGTPSKMLLEEDQQPTCFFEPQASTIRFSEPILGVCISDTGEAQVEDADVCVSDDPSARVRRAASAYSQLGIDHAMAVYKGELDFEVDPHLSPEEIQEFMDELEEIEEADVIDAMQLPDEA